MAGRRRGSAGDPAPRERVPLSRTHLAPSDRAAVLRVLRRGRLALGPELRGFEEAFARALRVEHAVAVASGTAALHLQLLEAGVGPGDEVVTTPLSFVASANVILHVGARPVFADVDPASWNLDPVATARAMTRRTRAVLVVHMYGLAAPVRALAAICDRRDVPLLEDACEAIGARDGNALVGTVGRSGSFAFYPNKQVTTGEGGMLVTRRAATADTFRSLRNQGRDPRAGAPGAGPETYVRAGFNYRLPEISCALGRSQMARLPSILRARARVASRYRARLMGIPDLVLPGDQGERTRSWFLYVVALPRDVSRARILGRLQARGIPARAYFPPIHLLPFYRKPFGYGPGDFPVTEEVCRRTLALPFFTDMTPGQVDLVCREFRRALAAR